MKSAPSWKPRAGLRKKKTGVSSGWIFPLSGMVVEGVLIVLLSMMVFEEE